MPRLAALYVYPVKSCRGVAVSTAAVDGRGLAGDRRFLVVDADGRFLTQRTHPRMALIETALTGAGLTLAASGFGRIEIPRQPAGKRSASAVSIWKDTVTAEDCGREAASWLGNVLHLSCRLVRTGADFHRPIPADQLPAALPPAGRDDHEVSFADAFPFLVISEASLADLNSRMEAPLPMNRFRPNLVVSGVEPYAEDEWGRFRIGSVVFHGTRCCIRCAITTTDQVTAERGIEPLRTLATYRRAAEGGVRFGRNLIHETKSGRLAVGDVVELL